MLSLNITTDKEFYLPGEKIKGELVVDIASRICCRGLSLSLHGRVNSVCEKKSITNAIASALSLESERLGLCTGKSRPDSNPGQHSANAFYRFEDTLIHEKLIIMGKDPLPSFTLNLELFQWLLNKDMYEYIDAGIYTHPFDFTLPEGCPGNYLSKGRTSIKYEIEAVLDMPWSFNRKSSHFLTVLDDFEAEESRPVEAVCERTFASNLSETLSFKAIIKDSVYKPGDSVVVELSALASSPVSIPAIKGLLQHRIKVSNPQGSGTLEYLDKLGEVKDVILKEENNYTHRIKFTLPKEKYFTIRSYEKLSVEFDFVLYGDLPWAKDLGLYLPIVLISNFKALNSDVEAPNSKNEPLVFIPE